MAVYRKGENWYVDYYLKGRRKRKKIGHSKKLALQVLEDIHTKITKKEYLGIHEEKKIPFEEYAKEYLDYSKANKAFSTYQRRDRINIKHLIAAFGGKYLFEITPPMIEEYKAMRLENVEPSTVNRELACLKHMYTKAIEWEYVSQNPAKGVKLFKEAPGRLRYLRPEEVEALVNVCADHIRPIVVTAVNTGMRKAEILNLQWSDIDLKNLKIKVGHSKNNESRVIPINKTLHHELSGLKIRSTGDYVFAGKDNGPYADIKKGFASALKRAGIKDFRFHDLRHTFGSHLVMQGVNVKTVQQLMGHKDIKMTMRYSHLSPEYVQEAMHRLDNVWTLYGHQSKSVREAVAVSA